MSNEQFNTQELKDAAQRCFDGGFDTAFSCAKEYYRSELHAKDNDIVSRFVLIELSRRDAERAEREKEAETPCPDCVILETDVVAVSVQSGLLKVGLYCADAYFNCGTVADLRRWCAALGCHMPELKPCERPE